MGCRSYEIKSINNKIGYAFAYPIFERKKMKKGIIFDLDGTLWDSVDSVAQSWNIVVERRLGRKFNITNETLSHYMGKTMDQFLTLFEGVEQEQAKDVLNECVEYELEYLREKPGILYPKVREVLEELGKEYRLFIVSNCQVGYIETFLEVMNMESLFEDFEDYGRTGLPKGENIKILIERTNIEDAIYVGDTQGDYEATIVAGIPFIFASYGFGTVPEAKKSIAKFNELRAIFLAHNFEK